MSDTPKSVQSIRSNPWDQSYPHARELTIIADDCASSNGARMRLWKLEP